MSRLVLTGASDTPCELGFDLLGGWDGSSGFLGLQRVPLGAHVVYSSPRAGGLRHAALVHVARASTVLVGAWDAGEERLRLGEEIADVEHVERVTAAARRGELDTRLAPVPDDEATAAWSSLTRYVSAEVVARLTSATGLAGVGALQPEVEAAEVAEEAAPCAAEAGAVEAGAGAGAGAGTGAAPPGASLDTWHQAAMGLPVWGGGGGGCEGRPAGGGPDAAQVAALRAAAAAAEAGAGAGACGALRFTPLRGTGRGAPGAERTAHAMDSSACLQDALWRMRGGQGGEARARARGETRVLARGRSAAPRPPPEPLPEPLPELGAWGRPAACLLGELQAAFALLLAGHAPGALAAWKALADALCRAEAAALALCEGGGEAEAEAGAGAGAGAGAAQALGEGASDCGALSPFPGLTATAADGRGALSLALDCLAEQLAALPADMWAGAGGAPQPAAGMWAGAGGAPPLAEAARAPLFLLADARALRRTCEGLRRGSGRGRARAREALLTAAGRVLGACAGRFGWELPPLPPAGAAPAQRPGGFASRAELLQALAWEAEGDEEGMPAIVDE